MNRREFLRASGVFVVVVVPAAAGTAVVPAVLAPAPDPAPTDMGQPAPDQWAPGDLIAEEGVENGSITVDDGPEKVVLIDRAHGNRFEDGEIQALVGALVANGHEVRFYGSGERGGVPRGGLNESLRGADAFVVLNPSQGFEQSGVNGIEAFAAAGGRVLFAGDPATFRVSFFAAERVSSRFSAAGSPFGLGFGTGYLFNMDTDRNANNYQSVYATPAAETALTDGVDRVLVRDATPVVTDGGTTLLTASDGTRLSTTRRAATYPVLVRAGNVTAFGDTALFDEAAAYDADNEVLLGNLIEFLVTGEKAEGAPAPPEDGDEPSDRPP